MNIEFSFLTSSKTAKYFNTLQSLQSSPQGSGLPNQLQLGKLLCDKHKGDPQRYNFKQEKDCFSTVIK